MPKALASLLLLTIAACSLPAHRAAKVVEVRADAAGLQRLVCTSHNGRIEYVGDPDATAVVVRAELSVRGHTPEEAEANLQLLEVGQETAEGALLLAGKFPREQLQRSSPSFAFTITGPARLELGLVTHNGDLRVRGADAATQATTHNGGVEFRGGSRNVALESHNGDVDAEFAGAGELRGEIMTHNGDVVVAFPGAVDAAFTARTHNGSLGDGGRLADAKVGRRELAGRLGAGTGKVDVTTHNGDVTVR
jgi:hypothetical protein